VRLPVSVQRPSALSRAVAPTGTMTFHAAVSLACTSAIVSVPLLMVIAPVPKPEEFGVAPAR